MNVLILNHRRKHTQPETLYLQILILFGVFIPSISTANETFSCYAGNYNNGTDNTLPVKNCSKSCIVASWGAKTLFQRSTNVKWTSRMSNGRCFGVLFQLGCPTLFNFYIFLPLSFINLLRFWLG